MSDREPSAAARRMMFYAQVAENARVANGPPCAYCGKRYDFANRPVGIENCCPDCLPPVKVKGKPLSIVITPRINGRAVKGIKGSPSVVWKAKDDLRTADQILEKFIAIINDETPPQPHRLDWSNFKGIARCTACSWTEVTWTLEAAVVAHAKHAADHG